MTELLRDAVFAVAVGFVDLCGWIAGLVSQVVAS